MRPEYSGQGTKLYREVTLDKWAKHNTNALSPRSTGSGVLTQGLEFETLPTRVKPCTPTHKIVMSWVRQWRKALMEAEKLKVKASSGAIVAVDEDGDDVMGVDDGTNDGGGGGLAQTTTRRMRWRRPPILWPPFPWALVC